MSIMNPNGVARLVGPGRRTAAPVRDTTAPGKEKTMPGKEKTMPGSVQVSALVIGEWSRHDEEDGVMSQEDCVDPVYACG